MSITPMTQTLSKPLIEVARIKISRQDISECTEHNGKFVETLEEKTKDGTAIEPVKICGAFPNKEGSYCKHGGDLIMKDGHIYMKCKYQSMPYSQMSKRMSAYTAVPILGVFL